MAFASPYRGSPRGGAGGDTTSPRSPAAAASHERSSSTAASASRRTPPLHTHWEFYLPNDTPDQSLASAADHSICDSLDASSLDRSPLSTSLMRLMPPTHSPRRASRGKLPGRYSTGSPQARTRPRPDSRER